MAELKAPREVRPKSAREANSQVMNNADEDARMRAEFIILADELIESFRSS